MSAAGSIAARRWVTRTEAATERLGAELAPELGPDGVLLLTGELGSGKTVLARGLAGALGIEPRQVLSPSFNLVREHRGAAGRMVHVDLYRLEPEETGGLGLEELLAAPGVKVVEWAERLPAALRSQAALSLRLRRLPDEGAEAREIVEIAAHDVKAATDVSVQRTKRREEPI
jgi:tRNA threonylcarbamoyladenosine biosynthesis protein TsaE